MFEKITYPSYKRAFNVNDGGPAPSQNQKRIEMVNKDIVDLENFLNNPKSSAYAHLQRLYVKKSLIYNEKIDLQIKEYKNKGMAIPKDLVHKTPTELCNEDLKKHQTEVKMRRENPGFILSDGEIGYKALWGQTLDGLKNDSMLLDYYKKKQGDLHKDDPEKLAEINGKTSLSVLEIEYCINGLKDYFGSKHDTLMEQQLENLRMVVRTVSMISSPERSAEGINPNKAQVESNHGKDSMMGGLIYSLNYINGKTPQDPYKGEVNNSTSFLNDAYNYNDTAGYDNTIKDPEALLIIRLGQHVESITSHISMIESVTPLFEAQNLDSVSKEYEQDPINLFAEVGDIKKFNADVQAHQKALNDLDNELAKFDSATTDEAVSNELVEKYKNEYEALIQPKINEQVTSALSDRKLEAEIAQNNAKNNLLESRRKTIEYNQRRQKDYEDAVAHNENLNSQINQEELNKKSDLEKFDNDISSIEKEVSEYTNSRNALKEEKIKEQQQFNKTLNELQARNDKLSQQLSKVNKAVDLVTQSMPEGNDLDLYYDLDVRAQTLNKIALAFDNIVGTVDYNTEKEVVEEALSQPAITEDDIKKLSDMSSRKYDAEKLQKAMNIMTLQRSYKENIEKVFANDDDPEIRKLISNISKCSEKKKGKEPKLGALDYLEALMKTTTLEKDRLYHKNKTYFNNKSAYDKMIAAPDFPKDLEGDIKKVRKQIDDFEKTNPNFDASAFDKETEAKVNELNSKLPQLRQQRTEAEQEHDMLINNLKRQLKPAEKPEPMYEKTDQEIEAEAKQAYDKLFSKAAQDKIKSDVEKNVRITEKRSCLGKIKENIAKARPNALNIVENDKRILKDIDNVFKEDKKYTEKSNALKEQISSNLEKHQAAKESYFNQLKSELQGYSDNMEKGKKAGHSNSDEFEAMTRNVNAALDLITRYNSNDPNVVKPSLAQVKEGLKNMKDNAFKYKDAKNKQFRPGFLASSMRHVRLAMADQIMSAADKMIEGISNHESIDKIMSLEVNSKVVNSNREVKENETAMEHFARIKSDHEKQFEKKQALREKLAEKSEKLIMKESSKNEIHKDDVDLRRNPLSLDDADKLKSVSKDDGFALH